MNLIQCQHRYDMGHDFYCQILNTGRHVPKFLRRRSLIQFSFSWNNYSSAPYIQLTLNGVSLSLLFWVHKFGFDVDLFARTWKFESFFGTSR